MPEFDFAYEAARTLRRIRPKILKRIEESSKSLYSDLQLEEMIDARLEEHWPRLFELLYRLYGTHYDFFYYLERILLTAIDSWINSPEELSQLDVRR